MRGLRVTLPVGIVLAALGVGMIVMARTPRNSAEGTRDLNSLVSSRPRHPVTSQMIVRTNHMARKRVPEFAARDSLGKPISLASMLPRGPVFLIFVMEGCPCSIEAEPFFERLAAAYGTHVHFVEVTSGTAKEAKEWAQHFNVAYPVLPDPSKRIVRLLGATNSAWCTLIDTDGTIVKSWPGYSQSLLANVARTIDQTLGRPATSIDFSDAPLKDSSGCAF